MDPPHLLQLPIGTSAVRILSAAPSYPAGGAIAPPASEGARFRRGEPCRTFDGPQQCGVEWDEWQLVRALVPENASVLELGARFGTTSCVLADATRNSGRVVSVEPDPSVHQSLLANRKRHQCRFSVVMGTVGAFPLFLGAPEGVAGVGTRTHRTSLPSPGGGGGGGPSASAGSSSLNRTRPHRPWKPVPNLRFRQVEAMTGLRFDTLLIDCEGCIENIIGRNSQGEALLSQLNLILLEQDNHGEVSYEKEWWPRLEARGFTRVWTSRAWYSTSRNVQYHSAWRRGGGGPSCAEYAARLRLTRSQLQCADAPGMFHALSGK